MLPFLKRKTEKAAGPLVPAWHPNFRNFQRLPDTKVVRTSFFVNGIAVVIAVSCLLVFAYQEYTLAVLRRQIADAQSQIDRDQKASSQAVVMFKKFQEEEKKIVELDTFLTGKLAVSDFLLDLGRSLPNRIALQTIGYRETGVELKGLVRGAGDRASGEVNAYVERLRQDPAIGQKFDGITQTTLARDPQTGRMTFELFMKFKTATKK